MAQRFYTGDTAQITATLLDPDGVSALPATSARLSVKKPGDDTPVVSDTTVASTDAILNFTDTTAPGLYYTNVQFTLEDGTKHSVPGSFEIVDPMESSSAATDPNSADAAVDHAWMKLEDLFDSSLGGPYMRDRTLAQFDREKMKRLLPDAIYTINNTYQPATSYDPTSFPYDIHLPLVSQAVLTQSIRHLMRSYVEQPNPLGGAQIGYFDRRDYLNRWQQILFIEEKQLNDWLDLFKRDLMGFGQTSTLVGGYASFYGRYPRYMRGRYPYVYRF
jgi:hypothetical protein